MKTLPQQLACLIVVKHHSNNLPNNYFLFISFENIFFFNVCYAIKSIKSFKALKETC